MYALPQFQYQLKTFTEARNKIWASEPYSSEYYIYVFNMYLKLNLSLSTLPTSPLSLCLSLPSFNPSIPPSLLCPCLSPLSHCPCNICMKSLHITGGAIDGPSKGDEPRTWSIPVKPDAMFMNHEKYYKVSLLL